MVILGQTDRGNAVPRRIQENPVQADDRTSETMASILKQIYETSVKYLNLRSPHTEKLLPH